MIPFLDLKRQTDEIREELDAAYRRFMDSGWYVLGDEVDAFEKEYAAYCEAGHCVGVGSGLDALHLALRALDIGPGDEVIVPSNTYIATWLAVTQVGATIVPVEPNEATYNICPELIAQAVTRRTKVILPVNLYGQPVDYDAIMAIAKEAGVFVVIDNAQAQGARYKSRKVGGIADIECHSFYPSKNLGAYGESGAITTQDRDIAERITLLRNYGSKVRYHNDVCGTNSRLDALQAAFLRVKLRRLDEWNARRQHIADTYSKELALLSGHCSGAPSIVAPTAAIGVAPAWHLYVVRVPRRDMVKKTLEAIGVQTLVHYPIPPHLSKAYRSLGFKGGDFPVAEKLASEILSLPICPHLEAADAAFISLSLAEAIFNEGI